MLNDIAFSKEYMNIFQIDITPMGPERTYVRIGCGITTPSFNGNENISQKAYLDGDGLSNSDVTGGQPVIAFSGDRCKGDPAQDYIASLLIAYGEARKTNARWISPDGSVLEGKVTIANIVTTGGEANDNETFSFEMHFNGMPKFTPGDAKTFPTSINVDETVSIAVGGSQKVVATVAPTTASPSLVYATNDRDIATVDMEGRVTGVKAGDTTMTIKSAVKPTVFAEVTIHVVEGDVADGGSTEDAGELSDEYEAF